jgi:hypothetical protein
MTTRFVFALALGCTLARGAHAQLPVKEGDRVRLTLTDGSRTVGLVESVTLDRLMLRPETSEASVLFRADDVSSIERSTGQHRSFARNFGLSVGIGGMIGGTLSALSWKPCETDVFLGCLLAPASHTEAFALGFVVGGALSVPVGLVMGATLKHDRWEKVPWFTPTAGPFTIVPKKRGIAVNFSFR